MRVFSIRLLWTDGRPIEGAQLVVERGSAPTPEISLRSDHDGRVSLGLPEGRFDVLVRTPGGHIARTTLETMGLALRLDIKLAAASDATPETREEDMTTTVSNVQPGTSALKLGSVSNSAKGTELAAVPAVLRELHGSAGRKQPAGMSARDLIVKGTAPFKRQRPKRTVLESVIGDDERVRILDTDLDPWRMICSLEIRSNVGSYVGTGWIAGPKTIITAGHCVHHAQMGGWASEIIVRAGRNGDKEPFGNLSCTRFSTTDRWFNDADPDFDYAAIHLGDSGPAITSLSGWFSTVVLNDAGLQAQRANVSGYPGDKGGDTQWFHAKQIVYLTQHRIFYDVDTMGGQSGAPVWLATDEGPRVVGIHAYGTGASVAGVEANSAPRITTAVIDRITEWLAV